MRNKKGIKFFLFRFWPVLVIIGIWVIFANPYFFQQKVPYPSKYQVTFFGPWSYYQEFAGPVKNNAMPDVINQIYPWKHVTIEIWKSGQIPYWNPYNFAGNPHLGNFQSAVFSPFNLLFFVLPFVDAWSMLILLQPLLAGLFVYFFMREMLVSKTGSVIGSIAFMFCGFMVTWMAYGTLAMSAAFLPLILFAIEKTFQKKHLWALPLITIGLAISFFSGHVQTSLYVAVFSVLYVIFKLFLTRNLPSFFLVSLFLVLGIGISLIQIIPTFSLLEQSVRSNLVYSGGQIPLHYLVTIFAPDFFGNPVTRNDWMGYYAEWASFIGIIPLALALFALIKSKNTYPYFFGILGVLTLAFSSDTSLRQLLAVSGLPVFATSIPSRMIVLSSFCFAVLAGFGFDTILTLLKEHARKKIIGMFSAILILFALLWFTLLVIKPFPLEHNQLAIKNILLPTGLLLVMIFLIIIQMFYQRKKGIVVLSFLIIMLVSFDSVRFATKWMPFDDRSLVFPDLPVIHAMQQKIENGRVFGSLGTQVESYYGFSSLEGYDPLYIGRYGEFIRSSETGIYNSGERSVVQLQNRGKYTERVLDLLGVNIIFHPKADTYQEWAFPVWANKEKYVMMYEDEKFQLFNNTTALPRAKLFYSYEVIPDGKKLLGRLYTDDFDFRNVLLLEEPVNICHSETKSKNLKSNEILHCIQDDIIDEGEAKIISYTPNKVTIAVSTDQQALLFLSDSFYSNWKVFVNEKESKMYRADYAFRAVVVPEGKSTVQFIYKGLF